MKKLLFLTPELPYPAHSGGKMKSLKLLERLMGEYEVSLACPLKLDDHLYTSVFRSEFCQLADVRMQPTSVKRTGMNLLRSYAKGVPLNVLRTANPALAADVSAIIYRYDVVFIDHYEMAQYVPANYCGQRVYHAHNAYHKLWERYADSGSNPIYRAVAALEGRRVRLAELAICKQSDVVFAAPNDIDALVAAGADRRRMHETYHIGDDAQLELPPIRFDGTDERLLYVGNLAWEPNAQGLHWFIENVWPTLVAQRPGLELNIVGRNPDAYLQKLASADSRIYLHGFVENLELIYPRSRVSIAPLTFGAGMKVKVLSAMARGLPVVTTSVGAEGIELENGKHLLVSDTAVQMADDIFRLLDDEVLWQRLASESRALVARRYTWNALFKHMLQVVQSQARDAGLACGQNAGAPQGGARALVAAS